MMIKMVSNLKDKKFTKLSKKEIVLISLYQSGGYKSRVHTEEVAHRAFQINRDLFCWKLKKFKNFPDISQAYKTLSHLSEEKKVFGTKNEDENKDGWILTDDGLSFCKNDLAEFIDIKKNKSNPQQHEKSYLISIKQSQFYKEWNSNNEKKLSKRTIYDVAEILKVLTSNTPRLIEKFYETKIFAKVLNENVHSFLEYIETKHNDLFNEERRKLSLNKSKKQLKKVL